jgi:hypothetical protein
MTDFPPTTTRPCAIHANHAPVAHTVEAHHIIPQSWQHAWVPVGEKVVDGLWYPETRPLCPSGHRDVHLIIDRLMHLLDVLDPLDQGMVALGALDNDPVTNSMKRWSEWSTAWLAPTLWVKAGGSLRFLTDQGLWGQA